MATTQNKQPAPSPPSAPANHVSPPPTTPVAPFSDDLRVFVAARTDIGRRRSVNEDAVLVLSGDQADLPDTDLVLVVADGMGGMQSGDVASREAVRIVRETLVARLAAPGGDPQTALEDALKRANDHVRALAGKPAAGERADGAEGDLPPEEAKIMPEPPSGGVMGTTCVAGVLQADQLFLAHVGDSRAYLLRGGSLGRLTADHSFVEERVRAGDLTEEEARHSRFRNMITRAIGIDAALVPDLRRDTLAPGDTLLLCTDGLTTMLSDEEIEATLVKSSPTRTSAQAGATLDVDTASRALIDLANRKGGSDNITVALVHVPAASGRGGASAAPPGENENNAGENERAARRRTSPFVSLLAFAGLLALLLAGALAALPGLRNDAADLLLRFGVKPQGNRGALSSAARTNAKGASKNKGNARALSSTSVAGVPADLSQVVYGKPETFVPLLARGDLLSYSSAQGFLYLVKDTSGALVRVGRDGTILKAVAALPVAPPPSTPIPITRNFVATDREGNAYVSHTLRRVIEKYSPQGQRLATLKGFSRPEAVAVDEDGNVYVVDFNEVKIVRAARPHLFGGTKSAPAAKPARPAGGAAR